MYSKVMDSSATMYDLDIEARKSFKKRMRRRRRSCHPGYVSSGEFDFLNVKNTFSTIQECCSGTMDSYQSFSH